MSEVLAEIEKKINRLSYQERLLLIERLAHSLQERSTKNHNYFEKQITAMASDPEIQSELKNINDEFALAEADGLENV